MKTITTFLLSALGATFVAVPALGQVHESAIRHFADMHTAPDEYYFFEDDRKQVVDYREARIVRICADESRHAVPLEVIHDGTRSMVHAGDCLRVEAKSVALEPAEELEPNYVIKADVETIS